MHSYTYKNPKQMFIKLTQQYLKKKRILCHDRVGDIPGMQDWFNNQESLGIIQHINSLKQKAT